MHSQRTVPAASLVAALVALGPALTGCSSDSDSDAKSAAKSAAPSTPATPRHLLPTATVKGRTTATYTIGGASPAAPSAGQLRLTVDRLRARATAFGLTGTTFEAHGSTITAQTPGDGPDRADKLSRMAETADLAFRPVLDPTAVPADLQRTYTALTCHSGAEPQSAAPGRPTVACDTKTNQKYLLGPAALAGTDVRGAASRLDTTYGMGWMVDLDFTSAGGRKFADVTGKLSQQVPPANQFAITIDGDVLSAPSVSQAITGGKAQITGNFTRDSAQSLAALITTGALPVTLKVSEITRLP